MQQSMIRIPVTAEQTHGRIERRMKNEKLRNVRYDEVKIRSIGSTLGSGQSLLRGFSTLRSLNLWHSGRLGGLPQDN